MSETLENCPFCGNGKEFEMIYHVDQDEGSWWHNVVCNQCNTEGPSAASLEVAIERWNRRAEQKGSDK